MSARRCLARSVVTATLLFGAACENGAKNMYDQPKYKPLAASSQWSDGRSSRPLEPDTIVHSAGTLAGTSSGRQGLVAAETKSQATYRLPEIQRGRERYDIYCAPCHGLTGDGNGYVALRGFPHPPSYHIERLRAAPDAYVFHVITQGYGSMYPYADRLSPQDRWAVVAYVRALQLSQHAQLTDVPREARERLEASP